MRIRTSLLLCNLVVVCLVTVVALVLGRHLVSLADLPSQEQRIQSKAEANARALAEASRGPLATSDGRALTRAIAAYRDDRDLAFVQVWDRSGRLIANFGKGVALGAVTASPPGRYHRIGDSQVAVWVPVEAKGTRLGTVCVANSLARPRLMRGWVHLSTWLVVLAAIAGSLVYLLFAERMLEPIVGVSRALHALADGEIEQKLQLSVRGPEEARDLRRSTNVVVRTQRELLRATNQITRGNLAFSIASTGQLPDAFRQMVALLRRLNSCANAVAKGNLDISISAGGELGDSFEAMFRSFRDMSLQIDETARQISESAGQILTSARKGEQGAVDQSSAVKETQQTMESLLQSAREIASTSQAVLHNAELTHNNNQLIAERISRLSSHMQRITEILEVIKGIASKSDLLALNASLEGTRAGEAGRGFSLVASQMLRLAESVMSSVGDIKALTADIRETTTATVMAIEVGGKLASGTTQSARQITMVSQQQQTGTEQVFQAMNELSEIGNQALQGSRQATAVTEELARLAGRLRERLAGLKLPSNASPRQTAR